MLKKEVSLIDKFKKLETEIIAILKENDIDFDDSLNAKEVKAKKTFDNMGKVLNKIFGRN